MDKNQIQKLISGLLWISGLLVSCQPQVECGIKCGIDMGQKEEKVCILLDTSLFKKPYIRYIPLPESNYTTNAIRATALETKTENWIDYFGMIIVYDQTMDSSYVKHKLDHMENSLEYCNEKEVSEKEHINFDVSSYKICDTLDSGYIRYNYEYYINALNDTVGWVEVYYVRKEAEDRLISIGIETHYNLFRSRDSLRAIQLIKSIELLKGECQKKCLCFPD